jgi:hypothetical protein
MLNYQEYKKEQNRVIYFAATIFISIITITDVFSAVDQNKIIYNYDWYHVLIFHSIFFTLYLLYADKMLSVQRYHKMVLEVDYIKHKCLGLKRNQIVPLMKLKDFFMGNSIFIEPFKAGVNPRRMANKLIFSLYIFISLGPFIMLKINLSKQDNITYSMHTNLWIIIISIVFLINKVSN